MSFFIRKKGPRPFGDLAAAASKGKGKSRKMGNTDMKIRKKPAGPREPESEVNKTSSLSSRKRGPDFRRRGQPPSSRSTNGSGGGSGGKKPKFDPNEEIISSSDDDDDEGKKSKASEAERILEDYGLEDLNDKESAQDKKLRLAKIYLEEIEREEKERREHDEVDEELLVTNRLKEDILEAEGRLRREVAEKVEAAEASTFGLLTCSKYLKKSVTCLCISDDDQFIFSGCKDGHLIKWSVAERKKLGMVKRKEKLSKKKNKKGAVLKTEGVNPNSIHSSSIMAIAISSDGKFLATGDRDKQIVIWDPETLKRIHTFTGMSMKL